MATLRRDISRQPLGNFLTQRHTCRLEIALIAVLLLAIFCTSLQNVRFHADESQWIATSYAFQALLGGDFSAPVWADSYWTRTQPPLTRYVIAVGWLSAGYRIQDLNTPWVWGFDEATNRARGALPSPGLLWWSRLPMAILAAMAVLAFFQLVTEAAGRLAGYILLLLVVGNSFLLMTLRRAMSETPLLLCLTLAMLAGSAALRNGLQLRADAKSWWTPWLQPVLWLGLMGFLGGLATAAKLNGALVVLSSLMLAALVAASARVSRLRRLVVLACAVLAIVAAATAAFVGCNPYLYPNVPARSMGMVQQRFSEMDKQQGTVPSWQRIAGTAAPVAVIWRSMQELSTLRFYGASLLNMTLCLVGLAHCVRAAWHCVRGRCESGAAVLILLSALTCAAPALLTPLVWDRYFMLPIVFSTIFIAVGSSVMLHAAARRLGPRNPTARVDTRGG